MIPDARHAEILASLSFSFGGGGGGRGGGVMDILLLSALASRQPPPTPQIDEAMSQRNIADTTAIRRRFASTALTGVGGLPDLGATKVPVATSASATLR